MADFSHYSADGRLLWLISVPKITERNARADASVLMKSSTITAIENKLLPKGDIFEVARIAGILAAKKTSDLIPMCHPLKLNYIDVIIEINRKKSLV